MLRYLNGDLEARALGYVRLNFGEEDLSCAGPEDMEGQPIGELRAAELRCLVETEHSMLGDPCGPGSECSCWMRPSDRALLLDCAARNLTRAPEWIDVRGVEAVELDLSRNELFDAPDMEGKGYEKVTRLNLAWNRIAAISESLVTPNLKVS